MSKKTRRHPLHPQRRYVATKNSSWKIEQVPYAQLQEMKPRGLWYAVGNGWVEWVKYNRTKSVDLYVYEVEVDLPRLLVIDTDEKFVEFSTKYRVSEGSLRGIFVDWQKVERTGCAGIEIAPYRNGQRFALDAGWYYSWDVASGCIWDVSAIRIVGPVPGWP